MADASANQGYYSKQNWRGLVRSYLYTSLFCIAIAVLTWLAFNPTGFVSSLIVSFSIGLSINTAFVLLFDRAEKVMSPYLAPIPITAVGLTIGLIIGGSLILGRPWFFFTDGYGTLIVGIFFGVIGYLVIGTRARLSETQAELAQAQAEQERQEKLLTQTELRLLQAQIEPHFLFNTLTNIASLIRTDPDAAEQMLENLTTLLRSSLDRTRVLETTLAEELGMVRAYLAIQETRMRGRLRYAIDHDAKLDNTRLPPLIVQPLVENAVKYAVDPREKGGTINIITRQIEDRVEIEVLDDGPGIDPASQPGTGIRNVKERLTSLIAGSSLSLLENPDGGLRAVIILQNPTNPDPQQT